MLKHGGEPLIFDVFCCCCFVILRAPENNSAYVLAAETASLHQKVIKEKRKVESRKNLWFSLVLFRNKYEELTPKFRTVILVNLKEIGLCCHIFLGS